MEATYVRSLTSRLEEYYSALNADGSGRWAEQLELVRRFSRIVDGDVTGDLAALHEAVVRLEAARGGSALLELRLAIEHVLGR